MESESVDKNEDTDSQIELNEKNRIGYRILTTTIRSALSGLTFRGGLHLLTDISKSFFKNPKKYNRNELKETIQASLFMGAMGFIYVTTEEIIKYTLGPKKTTKWRGFIAGLCAGPSILITGLNTHHYSLSTYILVKGLTLLIRSSNIDDHHENGLIKNLFSKFTKFEHGDVLMMCLSCTQILYSFLMMPQTLPKSYIHFIVRLSQTPYHVWNGLKEFIVEKEKNTGPVSRLKSLSYTGHLPFCSHKACQLLHPNMNCFENILKISFKAFLQSILVYIPVYAIPAILVRRKEILTSFKIIMLKNGIAILRSSLFLATFISIAFTSFCTMSNLFHTSNMIIFMITLPLTGLATFVEKKSRRIELAHYCLSRALNSFAHCLTEWNIVKTSDMRWDVILFSLGFASIMHCYSDNDGQYRHSFRNKYLNVFDALFGNYGINKGKIQHVPSNQDILNTIQTNCMNLIDFDNFGLKKCYKTIITPFKEIYDDWASAFTKYNNE